MLPKAISALSPEGGVVLRRATAPEYQLHQLAVELFNATVRVEKLLITEPQLGRLAKLTDLADCLDETAHQAVRAAVYAADLHYTREILNELDT